MCAHYFGHNAWLEDGQILRDAHRLRGIPAILIHGRNDLGGPVRTAWELAQAWPDARLVVIEDSGHTGSAAMTEAFWRPRTSSRGGEPFGASRSRCGRAAVAEPVRAGRVGSAGVASGFRRGL